LSHAFLCLDSTVQTFAGGTRQQLSKFVKKMKKSFFTLCCTTLFALFSAACSSSDDDGGDTPTGGSSGGNKTDCIATNKVKTLKLVRDNKYLIYEDYTYRYYLDYDNGSVLLSSFWRISGEYINTHVYDDNRNKAYGIKAFSDIANLQMLTDGQKTEAMKGCWYQERYIGYLYSYAEFAPGCGFIAWFKTETEDARYVRIRSTDYTLDKEGALSSVSIEYQLF